MLDDVVDPRYKSYISLLMLLKGIDVIDIDNVYHRFSAMAVALGSQAHNPKPYWIRQAIITLSVDYLELKPIHRRKNCESN